MQKSVIGVVVLVLIGVGAFFVLSPSDDEAANVTTETSGDDETVETQEVMMFSADEVAMHSSEDDCWTIVGDDVYDITSYVPRHPGGEEILRACGADGTSLFQQRTTSDGETVGSGQPHSSSAESQLESLQIGELSQ